MKFKILEFVLIKCPGSSVVEHPIQKGEAVNR